MQFYLPQVLLLLEQKLLWVSETGINIFKKFCSKNLRLAKNPFIRNLLQKICYILFNQILKFVTISIKIQNAVNVPDTKISQTGMMLINTKWNMEKNPIIKSEIKESHLKCVFCLFLLFLIALSHLKNTVFLHGLHLEGVTRCTWMLKTFFCH